MVGGEKCVSKTVGPDAPKAKGNVRILLLSAFLLEHSETDVSVPEGTKWCGL